MYLVLVLRNRGSNIKNSQNSVFSKFLFKKNHEADFFSKFFFDENVAQEPAQLLVETWCPYLLWVLRNLPHKFEKLAHVTKSAKKKHRRKGICARLRATGPAAIIDYHHVYLNHITKLLAMTNS